MVDLLNQTGAQARAADALLRGVGGRAVLLRMPAPASAGDIAEQLGLETPQFQDIELAPAAFRKARATGTDAGTDSGKAGWELLVSATAVEALVGSLGYSAASTLFSTAFGVLIDGVLLTIVSATESGALGQPYVYRLWLREPVADEV